uniref:Uncharacterized protein n=1 Tax=Panagrolaimus superbus TaxID=310955 RepID=A0A914YH37_9BILA
MPLLERALEVIEHINDEYVKERMKMKIMIVYDGIAKESAIPVDMAPPCYRLCQHVLTTQVPNIRETVAEFCETSSFLAGNLKMGGNTMFTNYSKFVKCGFEYMKDFGCRLKEALCGEEGIEFNPGQCFVETVQFSYSKQLFSTY